MKKNTLKTKGTKNNSIVEIASLNNLNEPEKFEGKHSKDLLKRKKTKKENEIENKEDKKVMKNKENTEKPNEDENDIKIYSTIKPINGEKGMCQIDMNEAKDLNEEEMNNLEYEQALVIDKRSYFEFYYSLLKKKHLILFIFLPTNDYNLIPIKFILFLISFSMYLTVNAFFFSDDTMNKIYEDNGAFNFIYQLPQILYSTVVSVVINMILKKLSLSEKQILSLKQEQDPKKFEEKSKSIQNCLKIRFIIFLILTTILMLFFWYFISCFCAVYVNTQMILLKDTFVSFGLSMAYPFGLNLLLDSSECPL